MQEKLLAVSLWLGWFSVAAHAQSSAFTYQGWLNLAGAPATGLFDLQFSLFNAPTAGAQYGITLTNLAAPVTNVGFHFGILSKFAIQPCPASAN